LRPKRKGCALLFWSPQTKHLLQPPDRYRKAVLVVFCGFHHFAAIFHFSGGDIPIIYFFRYTYIGTFSGPSNSPPKKCGCAPHRTVTSDDLVPNLNDLKFGGLSSRLPSSTPNCPFYFKLPFKNGEISPLSPTPSLLPKLEYGSYCV